MARDIKFRAFIKESRIMAPVQRMNFDCSTVEVRLDDGDFWDYDFEEVELMEFTGLFDDTGAEIFDDDIVEIQDSAETKTGYKSSVYITYDGVLVNHHPAHVCIGEVGMRRLSTYCDYGHGGKFGVRCKIIGNIYE